MPHDLVQVETTTHSAAPSEAQAQNEDQPRRSRRPRAPESVVESEPLVQIETRSATSGD
jgi:hypothetical protein